ncbi:hypothetical protein JCM3774_005659, partial [Rhodotorula dairenensis]
ALPPSLSAFQTSLAISNSSELPKTDKILELLRNEILRLSSSSSSASVALGATSKQALLAFVFVKNRSPHAALSGGVPLAVWRSKPVRVDMLRVWGCRAYHTVMNGRAKLDNKAIPLIFVGYEGNSAAYRLFDPVTRKMVRSRDTRFVEDEFPWATPAQTPSAPAPSAAPEEDLIILTTSSAPVTRNLPAPQTPVRNPPAAPLAPLRPAQARDVQVTPPPPPVFAREDAPLPPLPPYPTPKEDPDESRPAPEEDPDESRNELDSLGNDPFGCTLAEVEALHAAASEELSASDEQFSLPTSDPRNHREAMHDSDAEHWRLGEQDEFTLLRDKYHVFHGVDCSEVPPDAKILGGRFVYRRKKDQHGLVTGHKVRLVAQGFTQRPNVDFRETFAPVVKFTSIRVLLALAARYRLHVHQADVDKAYLHGSLKEELYMRIPEGIDSNEFSGKVLKLDQALYGLKQAGRVWNHRIHATLEGLGYSRTKSDACIYVCREGGQYHYIALYVDDLLFVSPNLDEIQRVKDGLKREYGIKDLGKAKFILGIQVHRRENGGIFLSQRAYLEDVLLRLGHADGRTAPTPMQPNLQLAVAPEDHQPTPAFHSRYLQAVGSLMYAMLGTRPDLCYAVGVLGRHAARPDASHWAAIVRVLQYIKGTLDMGLEFQPDDSPLAGFEAYSDSDWGACRVTSRSTMGYTFVLASGAVSWLSKLQPRVTASSTEAEYLGLSHASKEAIHLSQLLTELAQGQDHPVVLFGDNQGANALSRDPQFHDRTRHLRLTEHFVREQVQQGELTIEYIPTARMVADIMTKSLPVPVFVKHRTALGIRPLRARGGVAADALPTG